MKAFVARREVPLRRGLGGEHQAHVRVRQPAQIRRPCSMGRFSGDHLLLARPDRGGFGLRGPEAEALVEPKGAGPDRLLVVMAELIAVEEQEAEAEAPPREADERRVDALRLRLAV